jgi:uncharacterized protein YecE (DUF72 family)
LPEAWTKRRWCSPANLSKWVANVPQGFMFHFKAFGLFCAQACPANAIPHAVRDEVPASRSSGVAGQTLVLCRLHHL